MRIVRPETRELVPNTASCRLDQAAATQCRCVASSSASAKIAIQAIAIVATCRHGNRRANSAESGRIRQRTEKHKSEIHSRKRHTNAVICYKKKKKMNKD